MKSFYGEDLAYVHDNGFCDFAQNAGKAINELLNDKPKQKIVDLGCGSGVVAQVLHNAGHDVHGIDISADLIKIAKTRLPECRFISGSFYDASIPSADCIISISECFNYISSDDNNGVLLNKLLSKVYDKLSDNGLFVFDMLVSYDKDEYVEHNYIFDEADWCMFVKVVRNPVNASLSRDVTLFREVNGVYRKSRELHEANIYNIDELKDMLTKIGFCIEEIDGYGEQRFDPGQKGFICRKNEPNE